MMKKILIIEDDPVVGNAYRDKLEQEGFAVEIAADGPAGLRRIEDIWPDGVLLDLLLPGMNGIELLKKIRGHKQFRKIPVIVFSNAYVVNMVQEAVEAGATAVFNKASTTPREIAEAMNEALSPLLAAEFATHVGAAHEACGRKQPSQTNRDPILWER